MDGAGSDDEEYCKHILAVFILEDISHEASNESLSTEDPQWRTRGLTEWGTIQALLL